MSLLIKGADISPDHIQCITVFPEGFAIVEEYDMLVPIKTTKCEVASVLTPHGRLIDADKMEDEYKKKYGVSIYFGGVPTVIEAEESK